MTRWLIPLSLLAVLSGCGLAEPPPPGHHRRERSRTSEGRQARCRTRSSSGWMRPSRPRLSSARRRRPPANRQVADAGENLSVPSGITPQIAARPGGERAASTVSDACGLCRASLISSSQPVFSCRQPSSLRSSWLSSQPASPFWPLSSPLSSPSSGQPPSSPEPSSPQLFFRAGAFFRGWPPWRRLR